MPAMSRPAPMLGPERRFAYLDGIEVRAATDDSGPIGFTGHAAVFERETYIGSKPWGWWESVKRGAFTKTIQEADVRFLHNHNPDLVLARSTISTGPGSLRLSEDDAGLLTDADFIRTSYADDLAVQLDTRVVSQMSFSFRVVKEAWSTDDNGDEHRDLQELGLYDVSTVTFPAYTETDAALRAVGMDLLLGSTDLSDEQRARLHEAIRAGVISPDLAPVIRAASKALGELAQKCEPDDSTRAQDDPALVAQTERIRRQMRGLSALSSEWSQKGSKI